MHERSLNQLFQTNEILSINHLTQSQFSVSNELRVLLVLKGTLSLNINGHNIRINQGDLYILNQGDLVSLLESSPNTTLVVCLKSSFHPKDHTVFHLNGPLSVSYYKDAYQDIVSAISVMYIESLLMKEGYQYMIDGQLNYLYGLILRHFRTTSTQERDGKRNSQRKIEEVMEYINQHYQNKLTLDELADTFYISKYYLSREFKSHLNMTIGHYIKEVRLVYAEHMVVETNLKFVDIASQNGFPNLSAFNTAFKQKYTMAPNRYRKAQQSKVKEYRDLELDDSGLEFLAPFISKEGYMSLSQSQNTVIEDTIDLEKKATLYPRRTYYMKTSLEFLEKLKDPPFKSKINLIGIDKIAELVEVEWENGKGYYKFKKIDLLIQTIINRGYLPYIQLQASDFIKWKKTQGENSEKTFVSMLQELNYHLIKEFETISEWYIEFRCYFEGEEFYISQPLVEGIKCFDQAMNIVVHFPRFPAGTISAHSEEKGTVLCVNDYTQVKKISMATALNELTETKQLNIMEEKQNEKHQEVLYRRIQEIEKDSYFSKYTGLIQANISVWNFLKNKDRTRTFFSPLSIDTTKHFDFFPDKLAEKYALFTREGMVTENYYVHVFLNNLYDEVLEKKDQYIITRKSENYRILSLYPEEKVFYYLNRKKDKDQKQFLMLEKTPYLQLKLRLTQIEGTYEVVIHELSPDILDTKEDCRQLKTLRYKSSEDIEYYNATFKPSRKKEIVEIKGQHTLKLLLPIMGVLSVELNKIK